MKSTGISRKIDELGRVVIPKEIRNNLNINVNDEVEIYIDDKKVILEKYSKLDNIKSLIDIIIKNVLKITNNEIIITDKEKVVNNNNKITDELLNIINNNLNVNQKINITSELKMEANINLIRQDYIPIGCVITMSNSKLDNEIGYMVAEILSNYLAN